MRFRGKSIRRKIVALLLVPLVSLTAIWAFATVITSREAIQLMDAADVIDKVGTPAEDAVQAIQKERRQTLIYLADRNSTALAQLRERQHATDTVLDKLRDNARSEDTRDSMNSDSESQLATFLDSTKGLDELRGKVENNSISRASAFEKYNFLVDGVYNFRYALHTVPNADIDKHGRAIVAMIRAREALAREDALYVAGVTAKKISWQDLRKMSDLRAERDLIYATNLPVLPVKEQKIIMDYRRTSAAPEALYNVENAIQNAGPSRTIDVVDRKRWEAAVNPSLDDYDRLGKEYTDRYEDDVVRPEAMRVMLRAGAAGVLGFLALLASLFVSIRIGRALIRDLQRLRKDAHEVSGVRLPSVMRRLAAGEQVDVEAEAPRLEYGGDEMGQVGQALNTLQRAAVEAAVKQADMRRGVSEVFVNLARRHQVLLHRQLTLLDAMERRTEDTDELADLFRLDHMTTRMRRHAEGLVILSGAAPSRQWRKPIQLMDVVRAAVAEVEDYERIEVRRLPRLAVNGPAVADLTHLIAELLENAAVFSPPHTAVQVHGERVSNGFTLEIHDRGLGMAPDALLEANLRLAETRDFELSDTDRLGLFVVSRLAQRQGVRVSLQPSPYGGTTAVVLIPANLLSEGEVDQGNEPSGEETRRLRPSETGIAAIGQGSGGRKGKHARALDNDPLDGPVELEASITPFEDEEPDDVEGGWFQGRGVPQPGPDATPASEHQQAGDDYTSPSGEPISLPRRRHPVLVSDHGRPVESPRPGRDQRPGGQPGRPMEPVPDPEPTLTVQRPAQPPARPASPASAAGLPRRVRQASLAPQLKKEPAHAEPEPQPDDSDPQRDAEMARAKMASLQRGWQRGRQQHTTSADSNGPAGTAPGTTWEGDGR
ncbi:sensor histidine kinase [Streptomyces buecherae]|uniref:sensor histidine kinase n=1 Tax=Streptomyces buecherae TaxID=2763006 RepID=UPI00164D879F|nr:nitrate- and nitrite sensing domain-containing protein [Streptomyces buecherae]MBC3985418.1 nitrate- and nitrite sensing domain-containing protein [Streptomyces buecherae]MBC3990548.1 nitrate- and nitrite sensing domain-containing protein [Streptomyces buecherae]QNJ38845.1 nitrate- and nitrite sensing domain-containing protein [Streptomyces buecherae]